jgi:hypothetical protein
MMKTRVVIKEDSGGIPLIDICSTWARYKQVEDGGWQREPRFNIRSEIPVNDLGHWPVGSDIDLYMRSRLESDGSYRVSLHLINRRAIRKGERATTSDFVFQPQIRIHCTTGQLLSVDMPPQRAILDPLSFEDMQQAMLYREHLTLARGHLCGAVWKDIDPERPHPTLPSPNEAPFAWTDRSLVPVQEQEKFSPADARTEFIPCYPVESLETKWAGTSEKQPQLNPLLLAQTWMTEDIHRRLDLLVEGYERWIDLQYQHIHSLSQHWQSFAENNLMQCKQAAGRIRDGIKWLIDDEAVRLAFCFANQAIAIQSQWSSGETRKWRPFQLAFILLNIAALANPMHDDRNICDLLWFPTGGGKTEAYLGLAAFSLGLRRLRAGLQGKGDFTGAGVGVLSRYTLRLLTIQQFRRALGVITACEVLRVEHLNDQVHRTGWRPTACHDTRDFLWGGVRFSLGMWVGGGVTPNSLFGMSFPAQSGKMRHIAGGLEILQGLSSKRYDGPVKALHKIVQTMDVDAEGDPAQVLNCPVCHARLAIPEEGLSPGQYTLHFVLQGNTRALLSHAAMNIPRIHVDSTRLVTHAASAIQTLSVTFPSWALCSYHQILYLKRRGARNPRQACPRCQPLSSEVDAWQRVRQQAIRFVQVCPRGHLDDVNWVGIIQHQKQPCQPAYLNWRSGGSSLRNIDNVCPDCEGFINLGFAYSGRTWQCSGRYPEYKSVRTNACDAEAKMLQRGASNLRMPELYSSLTIPPVDTRLHRLLETRAIREALDLLDVTSKQELMIILNKLTAKKYVGSALVTEVGRYDEQEILTAINQMKEPLPETNRELRLQEFEALKRSALLGAPPQPSSTPGAPPQFEVIRRDVREFPGPNSHSLRVTPVSRLRVVMVQMGYRRIDPLKGDIVDCVYVDNSGRHWYPGVEHFGEGIFIDLAPGFLTNGRHFPLKKDGSWFGAWRNPEGYRQRVQYADDRDYLHPVFVWWHTLAHRLINAFSIDSGYSSAAVRERVYIDIDETSGEASGGILLYTVQPGGDGTLGGIIALVPQFDRVLRVALNTIDGCSNDPLCSEVQFEGGKYNGSACYACQLVSETSCEHRNTRLDRTLLKENLP